MKSIWPPIQTNRPEFQPPQVPGEPSSLDALPTPAENPVLCSFDDNSAPPLVPPQASPAASNPNPETISQPTVDSPPLVPASPASPDVPSASSDERAPGLALPPQPRTRSPCPRRSGEAVSQLSATRATRVGKIARLPQTVREQLNQRLRDGQPGSKILPWLNALAETRVVLLELFGGKPITAHNLCTWRRGGFAEWEKVHDQASRLQDMAFLAMKMANGDDSRLAESACAAAATKVFELLGTTKGEVDLNALGAVIRSLGSLRSVKADQERAEAGRQLVRHKEEQARLARDEFEYRVRQDKEKVRAEKRREAAARRTKRFGLSKQAQRRIERAARLL